MDQSEGRKKNDSALVTEMLGQLPSPQGWFVTRRASEASLEPQEYQGTQSQERSERNRAPTG